MTAMQEVTCTSSNDKSQTSHLCLLVPLRTGKDRKLVLYSTVYRDTPDNLHFNTPQSTEVSRAAT